MLKHATKILALLCLFSLPISGFCLAWESGADAMDFRTGNLEEVKRAIEETRSSTKTRRLSAKRFRLRRLRVTSNSLNTSPL